MASISAQDLPVDQYEVILALASTDDDRAEYLRSLRPASLLRIVEQSDRTLAVALNECVAIARGSTLLFTDDELVLDRGNFGAHLEAHNREDSPVVYGPTLVSVEGDETLAAQLAREMFAEENKDLNIANTPSCDGRIGTNFSIQRATVLACGGFDEDLSWRCRDEFVQRLAKTGNPFFYEPTAIGEFKCDKTAEQLTDEALAKGKEEIPFLRKHPELRPYSALSESAEAPALKRLVRKAATWFPGLPDILLWSAFACADRLRFVPLMRRSGLRLLRARVALSFLRGAAEVAGWDNIDGDFGRRLPVLMYHHVGPPQPDSEPALLVSDARFEAHMRFLARRGYTGIRASDWLAWLRYAKPLPKKSVLVTFDDAIADLCDHAFPVLERYGINAVVFVPTNCVGKGNLWNYPLGYRWRPCMTAEQIRYWSMREVDFGAHSRNHPDLTTLGETELQDEIAGSRADLEKIIGTAVISFAYPYGPYNTAAAECVHQNFELGFTTDEGLNTLRTDRSLLRRVAVFDWDTIFELELILRLGWNPIGKLRSRVRLRSRLSRVLQRMRSLYC